MTCISAAAHLPSGCAPLRGLRTLPTAIPSPVESWGLLALVVTCRPLTRGACRDCAAVRQLTRGGEGAAPLGDMPGRAFNVAQTLASGTREGATCLWGSQEPMPSHRQAPSALRSGVDDPSWCLWS